MNDAHLTVAAAVSALDELIAVADYYSTGIAENPTPEAISNARGLPDSSVAAHTARHYLIKLGLIADAERFVPEAKAAVRAATDYAMAVAFMGDSPEDREIGRQLYGPFPDLTPDSDSEERLRLHFDMESVIAKLRRHAQRVKCALQGTTSVTAAAENDPAQVEPEVGVQSEDTDEVADSASPLRAIQLAFLSYQYAEDSNARILSDSEAYAWLKEHGFEVEKSERFGSLADYKLPAIQTWITYVRKGRPRDQKKNQPRAGREGRSIVRRDQV